MATQSTIRHACLAALLLSWPDCCAADPGFHKPATIDTTERSPGRIGAAPIGTATMLADDTILLRLRAEGHGSIGDAQFRNMPRDPHYQGVRDHLPGLRPGATVSVPPFE